MKTLWKTADQTRGLKTYASYANALKAAEKIVGDRDVRVLIATNEAGRFFPVALGQSALDAGLHFHMAVTN